MHKQNFIGMATAGAILASIIMAAPASAGWNNCGCRSYGYYAPRAYSYAPSRWAYRSYYRPAFYGASFYRPRVWAWRSWGGRHWGWGGRRWGWRGGWGGRHWGWRGGGAADVGVGVAVGGGVGRLMLSA